MFFDRVNTRAPFRLFSNSEASKKCTVSQIAHVTNVAQALLQTMFAQRYLTGWAKVCPTFSEKIFYAGNWDGRKLYPYYKIVFTNDWQHFALYSIDYHSPDLREKELITVKNFPETREGIPHRKHVSQAQNLFSCNVCTPAFFEEILDFGRSYSRDFLPSKKFSYDYFSFNGEDF